MPGTVAEYQSPISEAMELREFQASFGMKKRVPPANRKAFDTAVSALKNARVPHALVGGLGVISYLPPRYTKDTDFIVLARDARRAGVALQKAGFRVLEAFTPVGNLAGAKVTVFGGPGRVDVIASKSPFFEMALRGARKDSTYGVRVAPIEALIVMKKLAYETRLRSLDGGIQDSGFQDESDYKRLIATRKWNKTSLGKFADLAGVRDAVEADCATFAPARAGGTGPWTKN